MLNSVVSPFPMDTNSMSADDFGPVHNNWPKSATGTANIRRIRVTTGE